MSNTFNDQDLSGLEAVSGFPIAPAGAYTGYVSLERKTINDVPSIVMVFTVASTLALDDPSAAEVDSGFEVNQICMLNDNAKYSIGKIDKILEVLGKSRAELKSVDAIVEAAQNVAVAFVLKVKPDKKNKEVLRNEVLEASIMAG
jgi:hypothetical protein